MLKNLLREPLIHFLLIGAALFVLYSLQNDDVVVDESNRIVITAAHTDRLVAIWQKRWHRPPTQEELEGLIEQQIHEEVLYREALSMGLDKHDSIVRRRLAQKLEFISADIAAQVQPTDVQLTDYLAANAEKFELPGRVSFNQIYFNTDKRGDQVEPDAMQLLTGLEKSDGTVDVELAGDAFMFGQQHENQTEHDVARLFGAGFAKDIFELPAGAWQGPVSSGYGLHLVRINSITAAIQPELNEVRGKVRSEWLAEKRRLVDESFYQGLRQRYEIVVEDTTGDTENP